MAPPKGKLTPKQKRFCEEYLIDLNGTRAAIRAKYSKKTAGVMASENLKKPNVSAYLAQLAQKRSEKTEITAERVLAELAKLAFFNRADVQDEDGNTKPLKEWSRDQLAAVQEVTESTIMVGKRKSVKTLKTKVADKKGSLELLGRHLKLFTDKVEHLGKNGGPIETTTTFKFVPVGPNKTHA